jgi:tripartite-type tricarboxylate transporter receptor subunit TctC
MHIRLRALALIILAAGAAAAAQAQQYPARQIRFISPFPPGGGNDTLSRIVAERIGEQLGQRVLVENRPGANTIVGTETLAKAPPDGYTFELVPNTFATNPSFYPKLPYDTLKDFTPVGQVALSPQMLVAHPSMPVKTVKDLLALARAKPGQVSYATTGTGSVGHLAMLLLTSMTGAQFLQVPYKGTAAAVSDVMGGHLPLMMSSMLATLPQVRNGRLKVIAVTTAQRVKAISEVPTIAESGVPGYEASIWYGFIAPAKTPEGIVKRFNAELATAVKAPEVIEKLSAQGVEPFHTSPERFGTLIRTEHDKWAKVIKAGNIKPE